MEYKPKIRRRGLKQLPWGYFVSPFDDGVLLPDQVKLDALHYAFRMKAKYQTPIRSCTMWLHAATGKFMTPAGFMYAYKNWVKKLRKENMTQIQKLKKEKIKEQEKIIAETHGQFGAILDDRPDITALAHGEADKAWKTKK